MAHNADHNALVAEALRELAKAGYCAWETETGVWFEKNESGEKGRPHAYGKKGCGDITCILPVDIAGHVIGMHCEFEAKTGTGRQNKNQKIHQEFVVERNGGIYILFRSAPELLAQLATLKSKFKFQ